MENNQPKGQEQDQRLRTGENSDGLMESQENNESLNTASTEQPVQDLREAAEGSGRSYDYGAQSSPEQGTDGSR
jgi:hypothetical protein